MKPKNPVEYAFHLLKRRMYSSYEMRRKLLSRGFGEEEVERTISELISASAIDDYSYARAFVMDRMLNRPTGPVRLKFELKHKGINEDLIDRVLKEFFPTREEEKRICRELAVRKKSSIGGDERAVRKVRDFLMRRGFSAEVVREVVKEVFEF